MSEAAMDRLFKESTSLVEFLNQSGEFRVFADEHLSKILLLAAASHFEKRMTDVREAHDGRRNALVRAVPYR